MGEKGAPAFARKRHRIKARQYCFKHAVFRCGGGSSGVATKLRQTKLGLTTRSAGNFLLLLACYRGGEGEERGEKQYTARSAKRKNTSFSLPLGKRRPEKTEKATHHAKRVDISYYFQPAAGERKPRKGEETLSVTKFNYNSYSGNSNRYLGPL